MIGKRGLFRGKTVISGEWVEGFLIRTKDDNKEESYTAIVGYLFDSVPSVIPETVCQCTGEHDAHGILIYEHDILLSFDYSEYPIKKVVREVYWGGFGWCIAETEGKVCHLDIYDCAHSVVVGNSIDNPELLNKKNDSE